MLLYLLVFQGFFIDAGDSQRGLLQLLGMVSGGDGDHWQAALSVPSAAWADKTRPGFSETPALSDTAASGGVAVMWLPW